LTNKILVYLINKIEIAKMKKLISIIITLISLNITIGQENANNQEDIKYGMGFNVEIGSPFASLFSMILNEDSYQGMEVFFPIETRGYLIEPSISYLSNSTEYEGNIDNNYSSYDASNMDSFESIMSLSLGIFKIFEKDRVRFYSGLRVGKIWTKSESPYSDDEEPNEESSLIIAPTLGAEYFISDNFTLSGESVYSMKTFVEENDGLKKTEKLYTITPKFVLRYYF